MVPILAVPISQLRTLIELLDTMSHDCHDTAAVSWEKFWPTKLTTPTKKGYRVRPSSFSSTQFNPTSLMIRCLYSLYFRAQVPVGSTNLSGSICPLVTYFRLIYSLHRHGRLPCHCNWAVWCSYLSLECFVMSCPLSISGVLHAVCQLQKPGQHLSILSSPQDCICFTSFMIASWHGSLHVPSVTSSMNILSPESFLNCQRFVLMHQTLDKFHITTARLSFGESGGDDFMLWCTSSIIAKC